MAKIYNRKGVLQFEGQFDKNQKMFGLCSLYYESGELMYKGNLEDSTIDSE